MSQGEEDPVNETFNLLNFVQSHAKAVQNGSSIILPNEPPPSQKIIPNTINKSHSPSRVNEYEIGIDIDDDLHTVNERPAMKFNPLSFVSSEPVSFQKQSISDQQSHPISFQASEESYESNTHNNSTQDKAKLSYSDVEMMFNRSTTEKAPSKAKYGIGVTLLKKMGYIEGKGLGKNHQGIVEPIKQDARQAGKGLDLSKRNKNKKSDVLITNEDISDEDSSEEENQGEGIIKFKFKSTSEKDLTPSLYQLIIDLETLGISIPLEIKQLSNESSSVGPAKFNFIELNREGTSENIQNIKKELFRIKNLLTDIISLKKLSEMKVLELQYLDDHLTEQIKYQKQITSLLQELNSLNEYSGEDQKERIRSTFVKFQGLKIKSTIDTDVEKLLVLAIKPIITDILSRWDPLDISSTDTLDQIVYWNESLPKFPISMDTSNTLNTFQSLLFSLWFPKIKEALENWPVDQPNLPITLILDWGEVLDESIVNNLMFNIIVKNIVTAIREWKINTRSNNSKRKSEGSEKIPPYIWIFEWLPFLSSAVEDIKNEFISKYGQFVDYWSGIDAIEGLGSFKEIVGELKYNLFLEKKVIPKLCTLLTNPSNYKFNSTYFDKSMFLALFHFEDHLPCLSFEKLLKYGFLANWTNSLEETLFNTKDFYKVSKILKSWYFQFKPYFHKYPIIKDTYSDCLGIISKFMEGSRLDHFNILTQHELQSITLNRHRQLQEKPRIQRVNVTFKDVIEEYCIKKGWIFEVASGISNDLTTGKKLFQIKSGSKNVIVSLESDVIFLRNGTDFNPISLYSLDAVL